MGDDVDDLHVDIKLVVGTSFIRDIDLSLEPPLLKSIETDNNSQDVQMVWLSSKKVQSILVYKIKWTHTKFRDVFQDDPSHQG